MMLSAVLLQVNEIEGCLVPELRELMFEACEISFYSRSNLEHLWADKNLEERCWEFVSEFVYLKC